MLRIMEALLEPGALGFYTTYEATELFATPPGKEPVNAFTIIVAEESS